MNLTSLDGLSFQFTALEQVPVEPSDADRCVPHRVSGACFSHAALQPLDSPKIVCTSQPAFALLSVEMPHGDAEMMAEIAEQLSASKAIANAKPYAHCYAGHQFGKFAGQLGDGAATSIGEVATRHQDPLVHAGPNKWELQFKGAGLTPYSR